MRRRMLGAASLLILILGVFGTFSGVATPSFTEVTLTDIMRTPLSTQRINGSDNAMNEIPTGTILMYQTNEGRYGVLEIVSYGRDLTLNWRTHPNAGENVLCSGKGLVVHGTYTCDLDQGVEGSLSADFQWSIVNSVERYIEPLNGAKFGFPLLSVPGGVFAPQPPVRLAYNVAPPRSITVEFDNPTLIVDLKGQGKLQLGGRFPQAGSKYYSGIIENFCVKWTMWNPYVSTFYHFRPNPAGSNVPAHSSWSNYALRLEIPDLSWTAFPRPAPSAYIIRASDFNRSTPTKYALDPPVTISLGPQAATTQFPYIAYVTFPKAHLEWFRSTGEGRLRIGNIVLSSRSGYWDDKRINVFHMGRFVIDLNNMTVAYETDDGVEHPTLLTVAVDDGAVDSVLFEPDLWR